jgi:hypothetical protein
MSRVGKVIALTVALTGGLWVHSYATSNDAQTYVCTSGSVDAAWGGPSGFVLVQHQEDSIRVDEADSRRLKDPEVALLYAAVPGLFLHGAGHFYAGDKTAGWVLVGGEILSLSIMACAVGLGLGESTNGSTSSTSADEVAILGGILFVGTWAYDIIGAPLAVQRRNREFLGRGNVRLRLGFEQASHSVRIQITKRF